MSKEETNEGFCFLWNLHWQVRWRKNRQMAWEKALQTVQAEGQILWLYIIGDCTCNNADFIHIKQKKVEVKRVYLQYVEEQDICWKMTKKFYVVLSRVAQSNSDSTWWCGWMWHSCNKRKYMTVCLGNVVRHHTHLCLMVPVTKLVLPNSKNWQENW